MSGFSEIISELVAASWSEGEINRTTCQLDSVTVTADFKLLASIPCKTYRKLFSCNIYAQEYRGLHAICETACCVSGAQPLVLPLAHACIPKFDHRNA
jgi:hypothetical protein